MNQATFTFRVDEDLKENFILAAKYQDRTSAQLIRDFMRDFVRKQEHDTWFREQVEIGRAAADAGNAFPAEEIEKEAGAWRAEQRVKMKL